MTPRAEAIEDGRGVETVTRKPPVAIPFGLLELEVTGAVARYTPAAEQTSNTPAPAIVRHNFFTEVLPVEEVINCRASFYCFMARGNGVCNYDTFFMSECGQLKVQVMISRADEGLKRSRERLAFVRVTPAAQRDVH